MTAPAVPAEILGKCHYYRTVCGLPCHVDRQGRLVVIAGGRVGAVIIPEYWGYLVKGRLADFALNCPIIWHPFRRMTFLTGADAEDAAVASAENLLLRTSSVVLPTGRAIVLPTPGDDSRGWLTQIRDHYRPSMATVLTALAACDSRERR